MACTDLILVLDTSSVENSTDTVNNKDKLKSVKETSEVFDIFISYSHRHPDMAKAMVDVLTKKYPDFNVFFDRSELKSGMLN